MKNPSSDEPKWLRNHWKIFKDLLNRADFHEEVENIRQMRVADKFMAPLPFGEPYISLIVRHSIPVSCMLALEYLISHPDATEDQLKHRLSSPVRWISHHNNEAGPAKDVTEEYGARMQFGGQRRKDALIIEIMPHTKLSEVKDFLDENAEDLNRILKNPLADSEWLFPPRLSRRVDEPNKLNEDILALHSQKKSSAQIARELGIDDKIDQSNIRKIISATKKKRNDATR